MTWLVFEQRLPPVCMSRHPGDFHTGSLYRIGLLHSWDLLGGLHACKGLNLPSFSQLSSGHTTHFPALHTLRTHFWHVQQRGHSTTVGGEVSYRTCSTPHLTVPASCAAGILATRCARHAAGHAPAPARNAALPPGSPFTTCKHNTGTIQFAHFHSHRVWTIPIHMD